MRPDGYTDRQKNMNVNHSAVKDVRTCPTMNYDNMKVGLAISSLADEVTKKGGIAVVVPNKSEPSLTVKELVEFCDKNEIPCKIIEPDDLAPEPSHITICGVSVQHEVSQKITEMLMHESHDLSHLDHVLELRQPKLIHDFSYAQVKEQEPKFKKGKNPFGTGPGFKTRHHRKR